MAVVLSYGTVTGHMASWVYKKLSYRREDSAPVSVSLYLVNITTGTARHS